MRFGIEHLKVNAVVFDHARKLACGDRHVNVGNFRRRLIVARKLELFGNARHARNDRHVFRVDTEFLRVISFHDRAEHLLRRLARRQVRELIGIIVLDKTNPTGTARCYHGQRRVGIVEPRNELRALFHYGHVRGHIDVEHFVKADCFERGDHFALDVRADGIAELLAERGANGGRSADNNRFARVGKQFFHVLDAVFFAKRARRANVDTLTASNARHFF